MSQRLAWLVILSVGGLLLALTLVALPAGASPAGTTYYVDPGGSDGHTCLAPGAATACLTIGGALGKAAASGDTIMVAAGTYHEHLTVGQSVTINGAGVNSTFVDGSATNRVMTINAGNAVTLANLTIKNGKTAGNGGGILNSGTLVLDHSLVMTNTAGANGGGIYSTHFLSLTASSVLSNAAGNGGGIYNFGPIIGFASATLDNSVVRGNTVITDGGGIYSSDSNSGSFVGSAFLTLENNTIISANIAAGGSGAGIYTNGSLNSTGSQIDDNSSQLPALSGLSGAGVHIAGGMVVLTNDTLNQNISKGAGGAIANVTGTLTVTNPYIWNNQAEYGAGIATGISATTSIVSGNLLAGAASASAGGIYNQGSLVVTGSMLNNNRSLFAGAGAIDNLGVLTMTNVTFQANQVSAIGGAIFNGPGASLMMTGGAVVSNTAGTDAGGVDNLGVLTMTNVTLQANLAGGLGGGLENWPGASLLMTGGAVVSNTAGADGGGVYNYGQFKGNQITVTGNLAPFGSGGGLYNYTSGSVLMTGGAVVSNTAGTDGGGVYNTGQFAGNNLTVTGNQAPLGNAGGLYNITGTLALTASTTSLNVAHFDGGGLYNATSGTLKMTGGAVQANSSGGVGAGLLNQSLTATVSMLNFVNNVAENEGGGIYNFGHMTIDNSSVTSNTTNGNNGGGIGNHDGRLAVNHTTISNNLALGSGGGIYNATGTVLVTNSTINGNSGAWGGGIYNYGVDVPGFAATLMMTNTTVSGNQASVDGGGLWNNWSASLSNVTLAYNVANSFQMADHGGGGIYMPLTNTAVLTPLNTIMANNVDIGGQSPDCHGNIESAGYNLLGNNKGCNFFSTVTDLVGTPAHPINPLLAPLALNGNPNGPLTHGLFVGSPAIDAGSPFNSPNATACASTDERGVARPVGPRCDMGAFEGSVPFFKVYLPLVRR